MLNPDETIVLVAKHANTKILMGFHPEPGNYKAYVPPGEKVEPGETWEFSCPLCHASLVSYVDRNLCAIDMHTRDEKHRVYFSRVAGKQATFIMSGEGEVETFGRHADAHSLELLEFI
jgi:hypothetical protein